MSKYYTGPDPCPKCQGERGDWRKGFHWTKEADGSTRWWPVPACNLCGGTGRSGPPYTTLEEYVARNRAKIEKVKSKLQGELDRLNAMHA